MTCELCHKKLTTRKTVYDYFAITKTTHVSCLEKLEKEAETLQREANIQRVKHNQELRLYQVRRLRLDDLYRKGTETKR